MFWEAPHSMFKLALSVRLVKGYCVEASALRQPGREEEALQFRLGGGEGIGGVDGVEHHVGAEVLADRAGFGLLGIRGMGMGGDT